MAAPMKGVFAQRFAEPYSGYRVWGTGINPVHSFYGSPPARTLGIRDLHGLPEQPPRTGEHVTPPNEAVSQPGDIDFNWGYSLQESLYSTTDMDNRVPWDVPPQDSPARFSAGIQPPVNASGAAKNRFRDTYAGVRTFWRGKTPRANYMIPTETVSEGWENKANYGPVAQSEPSAWGQYERQTAMQQRFQVRVNDLAVARATDHPRAPIRSRVQPQRTNLWSTGQRLYDMFPRQQSVDALARFFYYRTAGTGQPYWMETNEMWDVNAIERTSPPDPYIGTPDNSDTFSFGYTPEDQFYA